MRRAADAYAVEIVEPRGLKRATRLLATLAAGVATFGGGPSNPGGRTVVVVDRATRRPVARWPERYGDDANNMVDSVCSDLQELDEADFERRWITDAPSQP
jgi:hypothetical protein